MWKANQRYYTTCNARLNTTAAVIDLSRLCRPSHRYLSLVPAAALHPAHTRLVSPQSDGTIACPAPSQQSMKAGSCPLDLLCNNFPRDGRMEAGIYIFIIHHYSRIIFLIIEEVTSRMFSLQTANRLCLPIIHILVIKSKYYTEYQHQEA